MAFIGDNIVEDYYTEDNGGDDDDFVGDFVPTGDDFSIIVMVEHGRNNFLFTADATTHRRQQLLDCAEFMAMDFDFLKVQRHGRWDSRARRFLRQVSPQYAVITGFCPTRIEYYYPERPADADIVIATLEEYGAEIFFTMSESFRIRSDGRTLFRP
jgi:beta-lactamase superfamily II metal-dependent hydrolase